MKAMLNFYLSFMKYQNNQWDYSENNLSLFINSTKSGP